MANSLTPSLCMSGEENIFSCDFLNKKSVSYCLSDKNGSRYLEYRFGGKKHMEMQYRADESNPNKKFHRAEIVYANNSSNVLWFKNENVSYQLTLPMLGGPFLNVMKDNKVISHLSCKGGWGGSSGKPELHSSFIIEHGSVDASKAPSLWESKN